MAPRTKVELATACQAIIANENCLRSDRNRLGEERERCVGWRESPLGTNICFSQMELPMPVLVAKWTGSWAVDGLFWVFGTLLLTPYVLRNLIIYTQTLGFDNSNFVSAVVVGTYSNCLTLSKAALVKYGHTLVY